jgi:hypothetical protein
VNGNVSGAMSDFALAEGMWNGQGIVDKSVKLSDPVYSDYKLAYLILLAHVLSEWNPNMTVIENTLWSHQTESGGIAVNYGPGVSNVNGTNSETDASTLMAYDSTLISKIQGEVSSTTTTQTTSSVTTSSTSRTSSSSSTLTSSTTITQSATTLPSTQTMTTSSTQTGSQTTTISSTSSTSSTFTSSASTIDSTTDSGSIATSTTDSTTLTTYPSTTTTSVTSSSSTLSTSSGKIPTQLAISCSPTVKVGQKTNCNANVTSVGSSSVPSGSVDFSTSLSNGGSFGKVSCGKTSTALQCKVTFTPKNAKAQTITATYTGDATHSGSSGSYTLEPKKLASILTVASSVPILPLIETMIANVAVLCAGVEIAGMPAFFRT